MAALARLLLILFVVQTVSYVSLSLYSRAVRRDKLEAEWDEEIGEGDREAFVRADLELHQLVASAAGNPILSRFMSVLGRLGIASRRRTVEIAGVAGQVVGDHEAIVEALSTRDPEAAYQAMLQHLENVQQRLRLVTGRAA